MSGERERLRRLASLSGPAAGGIALGCLLSFATLAAAVGLMATAAYAVARAALVTSFVEIEVALAGVRVFALSRGALRYLERYFTHLVGFSLLARLRAWFYAAVEPLAPAVLWRHQGGDLLNRIVADIETLEQLATRVVMPAAAALLTATVVALFLALFDPRLGLILLAATVLIGLVTPLAGRAVGRPAAESEVATRAELTACVVDAVQGLAELLAAGAELRQLDRLEEIGRRLDRVERRLALLRGLARGATALLTSLMLLAILGVAVPLLSQGRLEPVYLAMLPLAAVAALEGVGLLATAVEYLDRCLAAAGRLFELADSEPALRDPLKPMAPPPPAALALGAAGCALEVSELRFAYERGEAPVLDGLSFRLGAGDRLAIVGASGSGKTTVVNLLLRFWEQQSGSIRVAGRDVRDCLGEDVRSLFAVVAQDTHLFAGTVRTNLLLACPDAGQDDLADACRSAGFQEVIERLPQGYDTWIGENGRLLSGGERQRLAIARAILKDAPILVLDEPTAYLDEVTRREVLAGLHTPLEGRTVVVVGQDAASLVPPDRILQLENGRLHPPQ